MPFLPAALPAQSNFRSYQSSLFRFYHAPFRKGYERLGCLKTVHMTGFDYCLDISFAIHKPENLFLIREGKLSACLPVFQIWCQGLTCLLSATIHPRCQALPSRTCWVSKRYRHLLIQQAHSLRRKLIVAIFPARRVESRFQLSVL